MVEVTLPVKPCRTCGTTKSTGDFYVVGTRGNSLTSKCKSCTKRDSAAWAKANPDRYKASARKATKKYRENNWWHERLMCARISGKEISVTADDLQLLWSKQQGRCFWTGVQLDPKAGRRDPQKPSLDRIDCSKGYTLYNIVLSCAGANKARSDVSPERFAEFCKLLRKQ